ncbi:hypothetical protein VPH35_117538 [Triticum aestivum]
MCTMRQHAAVFAPPSSDLFSIPAVLGFLYTRSVLERCPLQSFSSTHPDRNTFYHWLSIVRTGWTWSQGHAKSELEVGTTQQGKEEPQGRYLHNTGCTAEGIRNVLMF